MTDILSKIQEIFRDVLDDPNIQLTRGSSSSNIAGWDSLAHINLVLAIEQEFNTHLSLSELQGLKNVGDIVDLVQQRLADAPTEGRRGAEVL